VSVNSQASHKNEVVVSEENRVLKVNEMHCERAELKSGNTGNRETRRE
jgi:hypothetical protein